MKLNLFQSAAVALTFATVSLTANATANTFNTIYGTNFGTGSTYSTTFLGDVDATFKANAGSASANFGYKPAQGGYQGVGVTTGSDKTKGEIDIGESITGSFSKGIYITDISIGLLFDGPEYGDVNEKAQITASYLDGTKQSFTFTATGSTTAIWTGSGSYSNLSPATYGLGGAWSISNPFGSNRITGLSFASLKGQCGTSGGSCNNQSDFTLISLSAVPEPSTNAMMLAGLLGVGFMVRRKKQASL